MAVTKLWKITTNLNRTINYAEDHEKTFSGLKNALNYAENNDKTEQSFYITGINCDVDSAYEQMIQTKKCYNKQNGILGYHGYQSFREGEVTPQEAHRIGLELANEMWGDKYEVIVTTHLNTKCLHNHFVVNSVSFVDGKKFNSDRAATAQLRYLNDSICKEHGISFLDEKPSPKSKFDFSYYLNSSYKNNRYYLNTKNDIDYAIKKAKTYNEFIKILEELNYSVTNRYGKLSVKNNNYKRNIRIERRYGDEYTIENIKSRIIEEKENYSKIIDDGNSYYSNFHKKSKSKSHSIVALYRYYCFLLKIYPKKFRNYNFTKNMYEDLSRLDNYSQIVKMFDDNKIYTDEDYTKFVNSISGLYDKLYKTKTQLRKQFKQTKNPKEQERIISKIQELNDSLDTCKKYFENFNFISKNESNLKEKVNEYEKNKMDMDKILGKQI